MAVERTLHHFPLDPASRQVRLALGEKRIAFNDVAERVWEQKPEFLALNPSGMTPVLVETEKGKRTVICEARAVLEHIEETSPEPPLLGREPAERAEARRLMQWFDRKFDAEVNAWLLHEKMEKRLLGLGAPDLSALRRGRDALRDHLRYIETLLAERDWIHRYADMRGFTSQAPDTRLEVVASDDDPRISQALGEEDYRSAIDVLDRHCERAGRDPAEITRTVFAVDTSDLAALEASARALAAAGADGMIVVGPEDPARIAAVGRLLGEVFPD